MISTHLQEFIATAPADDYTININVPLYKEVNADDIAFENAWGITDFFTCTPTHFLAAAQLVTHTHPLRAKRLATAALYASVIHITINTLRIIDYAIQLGADIHANEMPEFGIHHSLLFEAALKMNVVVNEVLIKKGANPLQAGKNTIYPLQHILTSKKSAERLIIMKQYVNALDPDIHLDELKTNHGNTIMQDLLQQEDYETLACFSSRKSQLRDVVISQLKKYISQREKKANYLHWWGSFFGAAESGQVKLSAARKAVAAMEEGIYNPPTAREWHALHTGSLSMS